MTVEPTGRAVQNSTRKGEAAADKLAITFVLELGAGGAPIENMT